MNLLRLCKNWEFSGFVTFDDSTFVHRDFLTTSEPVSALNFSILNDREIRERERIFFRKSFASPIPFAARISRPSLTLLSIFRCHAIEIRPHRPAASFNHISIYCFFPWNRPFLLHAYLYKFIFYSCARCHFSQLISLCFIFSGSRAIALCYHRHDRPLQPLCSHWSGALTQWHSFEPNAPWQYSVSLHNCQFVRASH